MGMGIFISKNSIPFLKEYLVSKDIDTKGGYGTGPKRTWQLIRTTLDDLGMSADLLKHGVKREAFLFRLVDNLEDYMNGKNKIPKYRDLPFSDLAEYWKERWLKGRYDRVDGWHAWDNHEILSNLTVGEMATDDRV